LIPHTIEIIACHLNRNSTGCQILHKHALFKLITLA
jgi:hypothetical protein